MTRCPCGPVPSAAVVLALLVLLLGPGLARGAGSGAVAAPGVLPPTLKVAYLSERVEESVDFMRPALARLEAVLAGSGVQKVMLDVSPAVSEIGGWLLSGRAHLFASTPYPVLSIARSTGLLPRLHGVPRSPEHTVFVVRRGSPIRDLSNLDRASLAFTVPFSSPGYFVPSVHLRSLGYALDAPRSERSLRTQFSGGELNGLYWVFFEKADVAVLSESTFLRTRGPLVAGLEVIGRSDPYPGFLVTMAPGLGETGTAVLTGVLGRLHEDPDGRALLEDSYDCVRLEPVSADVDAWIRWALPLVPDPDLGPGPGRP